MPTTPSFAPPSTACPSCGAPREGAHCDRCGVRTDGPDGATVAWLDGEIQRVADQRRALLARLGAVPTLGPPVGPGTHPVFPAPSATVCPSCDGPLGAGRCGRCGLALDGADGAALWSLDEALHRLTSQRTALVLRLRSAAGRPGRADAGSVGRPVAPWSAGPPLGATPWPTPGTPPPPPPAAAWPAPAEPQPPAGRGPVSGARTVQMLLLGLGALCLVVAAIAFGALAWSRMGALAQGGVLAAATMTAAALAAAARRRGLVATAEALGTVAVAGALVDIQAAHIGLVPAAPLWEVWAVGTAVVAVLAWAFDRSVGLVSARAAMWATAQVPLLAAAGQLVGTVDGSVTLAALLLVQATVLVVLVRAGVDRDRPGWIRAIPIAGAGGAWAVAVVDGFVTGLWFSDRADAGNWAAIGTVAVAGLVAALVAVLWERIDAVRVLGSLATATVALVVAGLVLDAGRVEHSWLWMELAAATVAAVGVALPARWRTTPALVGSVVMAGAGLFAVPSLAAALGSAGLAAREPWTAAAGEPARAIAVRSLAPGYTLAALALLGPAMVLLVAWARGIAGRTAAALGAGAVLVLGAAVAPLALDLPVWAAALLPVAVAAVAAVLVAERRLSAELGVAITAGGLLLGGGWAVASAAATLAALGLVGVAGAAAAWSAWRHGDRDRAGAAAAATTLVLGAGALAVPASRGATATTSWMVAAVVLAVASLAGWLLAGLADRTTDPATGGSVDPAGRLMGQGVELVAAVGHAVALAAVSQPGDVRATGIVLLSGAVAMAAHAARRDRRFLIGPALAELIAFSWLQLAQAHVAVVEAYTVPLGLLLALVGLRALVTGADRGSWDTIGPGLVVSLAQTVALAVLDGGTVRPLVAVAAGAILLLAGVRFRLQAAVVVGSAAVAVIGGYELIPAAAGLPRFVVFAVVGAVLLGVGATFEQRRQDVRHLRDRFGALR